MCEGTKGGTTQYGTERRLRVVHVVSQLTVGGMEKLLVEFARHAARDCFDLHFISLGGRSRLADEIEASGWPVTTLEARPGIRPSLFRSLKRLFRTWRPDIVHTHNTKPLLYAAPAARLARVPVVVHTRHGQRYGATRRQTLSFRFVSRLADRIVCVSYDSAALSVAEGVGESRIATIWNGIDTARFRYQQPSGGAIAVMVGRICPEKDVATLLRAAAIASKRLPSLKLMIAGDGPELASLMTLAGAIGVDDRVEFLGSVVDVAGVLCKAAVFVLSSVTEGLSLTLLEAMARGLPVVATRVGGNPEAVVDGVTGLLVAPGSPSEMADAIVRILAAPERGREMGRLGRERVENHFDARKMVLTYEALYQCVCREVPPCQQRLIGRLQAFRWVSRG